MYIKQLNIISFGKFCNKIINLESGLEIIYGENETGKSTIHEFIRAILFGINKKEIYEKYKPFNSDKYEGSIDVIIEDKEYTIYRNFTNEDTSLKIMETKTKRILSESEDQNVIKDINLECYDNTISVNQLSASVDNELKNILLNYNDNLMDVKKARVKLQIENEKLTNKKNNIKKELEKYNQIELNIEKQKNIDDENTLLEEEKKLKADLDNIVKEKGIVKNQITNLKEESLKEKRKAASDKVILTDLENEITIEQKKLNKSIEDYKNNRYLMMKLKEELDDVEVCKSTDIEELAIEANKVKIFSWYFPVLFLCEIIEILYSFLFSKNIKISIISCVIFIITIVLSYIIIKSRRTRKDEFIREIDTLENKLNQYFTLKEHSSEDELYISKRNDILEEKKLKKKNMDLIQYRDYESELKLKEDELNEIKISVAQLDVEMENNRSKYNSIIEQKKNIEEKEMLVKNYLIDLEDIKKAFETVKLECQKVIDNFLILFQKKINEILSKITNNKYSKIIIEDSLELSVLMEEQKISIERLSKGTKEQIFLAIRLGAASLMFDGKMPVILDDIFSSYDNKRLANVLKVFSSGFEQVIILSGHTREKVIADKYDINYNLIKL